MSECKEVVIIIRPSFKKMLSDDACRAAVFNHFLYWIAKKVKGGSEYWYGSFEEIWESLDRSWGLSKTIQEIKALVADGFIGQRRNPKNGWDQTRHYFFEKEQGETLRATCEKFGICLAHIGLSPDVLHLLKITNAFDENNKCICSNQQIDLLDLPDRFVESNDAIPKVSTKVSTKDYNKEREEVAHATARSQSSQEISQDDEDTVKKEVVRGHHQRPIVDNHSPADSHQPQPSQPEHRKEDTNKVTQPRKPRSNKVPIPKHQTELGLTDEIPATAHSKPVEPHADMAWGTRKCLQWFDYWRGGTLIARYKLQQAASCAKGLAEQFDEATVIEIRNEMAADQYYIDRGGVDVCDVANNCHKYLNKIRTKQKPPSNEHKAVQHANAFIARGYDKEYNKRKLEEMRAENERRRQAHAAKGVQL